MHFIVAALLAVVVVGSLPTPAPVPSPFKRSGWIVVGAFTDNICTEEAPPHCDRIIRGDVRANAVRYRLYVGRVHSSSEQRR